jgi:hypothetical protein
MLGKVRKLIIPIITKVSDINKIKSYKNKYASN